MLPELSYYEPYAKLFYGEPIFAKLQLLRQGLKVIRQNNKLPEDAVRYRLDFGVNGDRYKEPEPYVYFNLIIEEDESQYYKLFKQVLLELVKLLPETTLVRIFLEDRFTKVSRAKSTCTYYVVEQNDDKLVARFDFTNLLENSYIDTRNILNIYTKEYLQQLTGNMPILNLDIYTMEFTISLDQRLKAFNFKVPIKLHADIEEGQHIVIYQIVGGKYLTIATTLKEELRELPQVVKW